MEKLSYILVVFLLFTINCAGQNKHKTDNIRKDSTSVLSNYKFKNFNQEFPFMQKQNFLPKDNFLLYYDPRIYYSINTQSNFVYFNRDFRLSNDPLYYYKNNLTQLLAIRYADYNKYDIGIIGGYLGMSRKAFAIILAILSIK